MEERRAYGVAGLAIALLLLAVPSPGEDFQGKVVRIVDGDTIEVLHSLRAERIRLHGVDAPEKSQAFGSRARQFTAGLVFGRIVIVREKGRDRYGRTVAEIALPDGRILNRELVANGFAWHYKRYSSDLDLARLEETARAQKKGLWVDAHPIAPWEFRRRER
jgi:endonuclease YncB( thermonuclease family)